MVSYCLTQTRESPANRYTNGSCVIPKPSQRSDVPAVLSQADLHPYFPYLHVTATADVVVFQPVVGMHLGKQPADALPCNQSLCLCLIRKSLCQEHPTALRVDPLPGDSARRRPIRSMEQKAVLHKSSSTITCDIQRSLSTSESSSRLFSGKGIELYTSIQASFLRGHSQQQGQRIHLQQVTHCAMSCISSEHHAVLLKQTGVFACPKSYCGACSS
jgi:hypothetical protein